jgi:hypothetical protein
VEVVLVLLDEPDVVEADREAEALLESVLVSEEVSVESVLVAEAVAVREPLDVLPVTDALDGVPVLVPVAPVMPKLGE